MIKTIIDWAKGVDWWGLRRVACVTMFAICAWLFVYWLDSPVPDDPKPAATASWVVVWGALFVGALKLTTKWED